ncbi:hypothetical protein DFH11DRAFT_1608358 [Phellopilus nigrolimitatus]|nr:hypothetical protein DFH11DRAFT_1608358 [Phellopilus nigrolimitatus]
MLAWAQMASRSWGPLSAAGTPRAAHSLGTRWGRGRNGAHGANEQDGCCCWRHACVIRVRVTESRREWPVCTMERAPRGRARC